VLGQEQVSTYFDSASMPRWMAGGFGWGTYVAESRFTAFGQPLLTDLGNTYGAVVSYQYDEVTNRLTDVALKREQIRGTDLAVSYGYDPAGNVTSVLDRPTNAALGGAAAVDNQCFAYDGLRRLTSAWTAKDAAGCEVAPEAVLPGLVGGAAPYWTEYEYDPLGNRTVMVEHATDGTSGATRTQYSYGADDAGPHALTSMTRSVDGGAEVAAGSFTYDKAGNQTSRDLPGSPKQILGWGGEGELAQVSTTGSGTSGEDSLEAGEAEFVYDAGGERLTRADASGTTVYLPGGQELHVDPSGVVSAKRYYSFAGQTVAMRTGAGLGGVTSLVNDAHGTPLAAVPNTSWSTTSVERLYTDPFGAVRGGGTASVAGDHQFLGKTRDVATGLTLLGARYYDELVGRFISVDPVLDPGTPAQFNAYVYSGNNPLTWSDPSGLFWNSIKNGAKRAAGAVGGFVKKHQAEIVGAVVGGATFVGCMAVTVGAGSIGCGIAAGAAGGAATNLWKSKVQKTQEFSWRSLAFDTGIGAVTGLIGGPVGGMAVRAAAPAARAAASSVASAVRAVAPRASAAVASGARSAASSVRSGVSAIRSRVQSAGARPSQGTSATRAGGACSFAGSTGVLLADGSSKAIKDLKAGEKVQAADPATGEAGAREVEAVHVHDDVMVTLVVDGRQIRTTEDHPFWSVTDQRFERADHLQPGELVLTADGQSATVDAIQTSDVLYDAAYNLTVADLHTYHVLTGQPATAEPQRGPPGAPDAVLVHNCPLGGGGAANTADNLLPGLPASAPKPLGLGSTGRTAPGDLAEQLAMTEVRSAPGGTALNMRTPMGDPRWPAADGWIKMSHQVNGMDIHYVRNTVTGAVDDFKFANPFNPVVLVQPGRSIVG
jgi:RHS repeat-associated protein